MNQFGRFLKLTALSRNEAIDLSNFRVRFQVQASDQQTPNVAIIRVYNLSDETINQIVSGPNRSVILDAGYENGNSGTIFFGDVKQYRYGKENNTDRYLDIYAADGDAFYTARFVNSNIAPIAGKGISQEQLESQILRAAEIEKDPTSRFATPETPGGVLPRGRVLYGMARDQFRAYSKTQNARWSLQNGQVVFIGNSTYLDDGVVVELNGLTGLVGYPEATDDGIELQCLLNPKISVGSRIRLDNRLINQINQKDQGFPNYGGVSFPAITATDGIYRVLVVDYVGDTRGNDWYCNVVCLALNPERPVLIQVPTEANP